MRARNRTPGLALAILQLLDRTIGLRVDAEEEPMGHDHALHGSRGYNLR